MDAEKVFYENVVQLVTKLGIPLSMCGHKYLCDSVVLSQRDRNLLYSINKGLYNEVAKLNNISVENRGSDRVCRAHAFSVALGHDVHPAVARSGQVLLGGAGSLPRGSEEEERQLKSLYKYRNMG